MSTNEQAADTEQITQSLISDDEARDIARLKYISMPVVRLSVVAKHCGRSKEQIETWRDEGNWLHERDILRMDGRQKLLEAGADPVKANLEVLKCCSGLRQMLLAKTNDWLDSKPPLDVICPLAQALSKVQATQSSALKALGLSARIRD